MTYYVQRAFSPTIILRPTSGQFALYANGTGTASFDHFRVTQYPDPALVMGPVIPRLGSSSYSWNAITPTGTAAGFDISYDGLTWTDVTASNGGPLPGFFLQPQPTIDVFTTNTSANYTSTNRTGGAVATATFDTANSRLALTGGTNGIYLNSTINRADVDLFADLDRSDAGGLVWRFIDQSNYYYLLIGDASASVGTPNTLTLYKVAANVQTQLATASISFTRGTVLRFRVTMLAGVITATVDGVSTLNYTDGSPLGAGKVGLFNNDGATGSRYYQLWITPQGDSVTGTPAGDTTTGQFAYTRIRLSTTDPAQMPQVLDVTTSARNPNIQSGALISQLHSGNATFAAYYSAELDSLVKNSGDYYWLIDQNGILTFAERHSIPAPWCLLSSDPQLQFAPNVTPMASADLYRNRQTITNCTGITATLNEQKIADGSATSWNMAYPLYSAPTITVQGVSKTVGVKGVDTGKDFYWQANNNSITQDTGATKIPSGYLIQVVYVGQFNTSVTVDNLPEQAAQAIREQGGTGIVEAWEDGKLMLASNATTYAQGLLARYGNNNTVELTCTTRRTGLVPGMILSAFVPEYGLNNTQLLITKITTTGQQQGDGTVLYQFAVTATNGPNLGNWFAALP
jgi:hypothetical protein